MNTNEIITLILNYKTSGQTTKAIVIEDNKEYNSIFLNQLGFYKDKNYWVLTRDKIDGAVSFIISMKNSQDNENLIWKNLMLK